MISVSILIPTVAGREQYLEQTVSAYVRNTDPKVSKFGPVDLEFIVLRERETCGIGWQEAAGRATGDYLHFSNDDIYPWVGWLPPLIDIAYRGHLAAPWISHGPWGQFFAAPEGQVAQKGEVDHSAMPFMHRVTFAEIAPIIPIHYGVDLWIAERARATGRKVIGDPASVICHFAAQEGRQKGQWTEQDLLDYDCGIALPAYRSGEIDPRSYPTDRLSPAGLERARRWREENVR